MKITYNLTVDDWVSFQEYYRKKQSPMYGCLMPILTLLLMANIGFGLYMMFFYDGYNNYAWLFIICILLLSYLLFMQTRIRHRLMKAGTKLKEEHPEIFGQTETEFFEEGFEIRTGKNIKFLKWTDIEKYDEVKDYVFFFSTKGYAYIVPKRDIHDMDKLEVILAHLKKA